MQSARHVPIAIGSQAQADAHFGIGSELARMFTSFFANNFANEVWGLPLAEPVGATAATGTIIVTAQCRQRRARSISTSAASTSRINIGTTDTVGQIATAIAAAINDDLTLPVTATVATGR